MADKHLHVHHLVTPGGAGQGQVLRKSPGDNFLLSNKMLLSAICSEHPKNPSLPEEEGGVQFLGAK